MQWVQKLIVIARWKVMMMNVLSFKDKAWLTDGHKQWLINGEKRRYESDDDSCDDDDWDHVKPPPPASVESLKGFSWKGGSEKVTNGILMWSKPFLLTDTATREKVTTVLWIVHFLLHNKGMKLFRIMLSRGIARHLVMPGHLTIGDCQNYLSDYWCMQY